MKDGQWYNIAGWMGKRLGLRANDLICFAVIYGFSMDGESQFKGTSLYLSKCMFASEPTALLCIKHLLSCNLILKQEDVVNGKKRCYYSTNVIYNEGDFEVVDTTKEPLVITTKEPLVITTKEPLVNKYSYNNKNKKRECNKLPSPKKDNSSSRFVKPTIDEVDAYIQEKGYHFDAERFMNHYESVGWMIGKNHMRDWKASCRTWECRYKSEHKEEKEEIADIPADDAIAWERCQQWMRENTPRIATSITYEMFASMRGMVHFKGGLYAEIIREIEASGFDSDIVVEFERICQTDKYSSRIWQ